MSTCFAVVPTPQLCSNEPQYMDFPCEPRRQAHPSARLAPVASSCRLVLTDPSSRPAPIYSWALGNLRSTSSLGLASANQGSGSFQWTQASGPPPWTQVSHLSHRLRARHQASPCSLRTILVGPGAQLAPAPDWPQWI